MSIDGLGCGRARFCVIDTGLVADGRFAVVANAVRLLGRSGTEQREWSV